MNSNNYINDCGTLCMCVIDDTTRKQSRGEWGITVVIQTNAWNNVRSKASITSSNLTKDDVEDNVFVYGWLIQKLSTQLRELNALTNASSLSLFHAIKGASKKYDYNLLGPKKPIVDINTPVEIDVHYRSFLDSKFTISQKNAILSSALSKGVTLIQGPPGTGKTYTLHALMNTNQLHHSNVYHRRLLNNIVSQMKIMKTKARTHNNIRIPQNSNEWWLWLSKLKLPKKNSILLVAPSNEAVDHLYKSIREGGFLSFDGAGNKRPCKSILLLLLLLLRVLLLFLTKKPFPFSSLFLIHFFLDKPKLVRLGMGGKDKTIDSIRTKVDKFMSQHIDIIRSKKTELKESVLYHESKLGESLHLLYYHGQTTNNIAGMVINHYNLRNDINIEYKKYNMLVNQKIDQRNYKLIKDSLELYEIQSADIVGMLIFILFKYHFFFCRSESLFYFNFFLHFFTFF